MIKPEISNAFGMCATAYHPIGTAPYKTANCTGIIILKIAGTLCMLFPPYAHTVVPLIWLFFAAYALDTDFSVS